MQQLIESNNQLKIFLSNELKNTENELISSRQVEADTFCWDQSQFKGIQLSDKGYYLWSYES